MDTLVGCRQFSQNRSEFLSPVFDMLDTGNFRSLVPAIKIARKNAFTGQENRSRARKTRSANKFRCDERIKSPSVSLALEKGSLD